MEIVLTIASVVMMVIYGRRKTLFTEKLLFVAFGILAFQLVSNILAIVFLGYLNSADTYEYFPLFTGIDLYTPIVLMVLPIVLYRKDKELKELTLITGVTILGIYLLRMLVLKAEAYELWYGGLRSHSSLALALVIAVLQLLATGGILAWLLTFPPMKKRLFSGGTDS